MSNVKLTKEEKQEKYIAKQRGKVIADRWAFHKAENKRHLLLRRKKDERKTLEQQIEAEQASIPERIKAKKEREEAKKKREQEQIEALKAKALEKLQKEKEQQNEQKN